MTKIDTHGTMLLEKDYFKKVRKGVEMEKQLIHIRDLIGKSFRGDPRTRKSNGELNYIFSDTPPYRLSQRITMEYIQPKKKPKQEMDSWSWFHWEWEQTVPVFYDNCCYSGMADSNGHCDDTYLLVEEVF